MFVRSRPCTKAQIPWRMACFKPSFAFGLQAVSSAPSIGVGVLLLPSCRSLKLKGCPPFKDVRCKLSVVPAPFGCLSLQLPYRRGSFIQHLSYDFM